MSDSIALIITQQTPYKAVITDMMGRKPDVSLQNSTRCRQALLL